MRRIPWVSTRPLPVHRPAFSAFSSRTTAPPKSLYDVLGVPYDASANDIKTAFYDLSKKFHPDLNPGQADEKFRELASAYEVLSHADTRRQYDVERQQRAQQGLGHEVPRNKADPADYQYRHASRRTRSGFKPDFGRQVDVDMSPERMARAWEAYKLRWEEEAARRQELDEMKLKFRTDWDNLRAHQYDTMSTEELERLREDMRMLRFGDRVRRAQRCPQSDSNTSQADPKAKNKSKASYETLKATREGSADRQRNAPKTMKRQFSAQDPKDPLSMNSTGRFNSDDVKQMWEQSQKKWSEIKSEWSNSQFLSDNTGSSQPSGDYRSHSVAISRRIVIGILIFWVVLLSTDIALENEFVQARVFSHPSHQQNKLDESVIAKNS